MNSSNNSGNTHPTTSPELWDKLRQIRWEYLADLPTEVADVMLEAADFVEAAMSQPQSPNTSELEDFAPLPDRLLDYDVNVEEGGKPHKPSTSLSDAMRPVLVGFLDAFKADPFSTGEDKVDRLISLLKSKEQSND